MANELDWLYKCHLDRFKKKSLYRAVDPPHRREASPGYEFAYTTCTKKQFSFLCSSIKTLKFNKNYMSSVNDTSINVCLLGNAKVGGLLGLGVQGVSLIFT